MATSLFGERSVAAASPANPFRAVLAYLVRAQAARARRNTLKGLLELDAVRLNDLGISRADIREAMRSAPGRSSGMILNAARARSARAYKA